MREVIETFGVVTFVVAFIIIGAIAIFGKPSADDYNVFKRCVEVGVEVEKCNTIAGFEKGEKE